jgi:putative adhesin
MSAQHPNAAPRIVSMAAVAILGAGGASIAVAAPTRSVDEHRPADPRGAVEIVNVSGHVEVIGWDKPEIEVAGTLGPGVERLEIESTGSRTSIRVVRSEEGFWGLHLHESGAAELSVHVPTASSLSAALVSSDIEVRELQGGQQLQTVSGEVTTTAAGEVRVHTVSGDVHLSAGRDSSVLEIGTVSGSVEVNGGHGDVSVNTISGDGKLSLGMIDRAHFKSVSGDYAISAGMAADGHIDAESVSGSIKIDFSGDVPPAQFDLQSFSGDLKTCFGQKAEHERYGPGSRLSYREGAGTARVRIDTNSGDVKLCARRLAG